MQSCKPQPVRTTCLAVSETKWAVELQSHIDSVITVEWFVVCACREFLHRSAQALSRRAYTSRSFQVIIAHIEKEEFLEDWIMQGEDLSKHMERHDNFTRRQLEHQRRAEELLAELDHQIVHVYVRHPPFAWMLKRLLLMYIVWRHVSFQWLVQCFLSMAGASFIVTNSRNVLFQWLVQSSQAQICFGAAACNIIFGAERPNHRLASMISGFISCPHYDWTCRSCGKSWTEKDSARKWVFPRPCDLCHRDMSRLYVQHFQTSGVSTFAAHNLFKQGFESHSKAS